MILLMNLTVDMTIEGLSYIEVIIMAVGRREPWPSWILKLLAKKRLFLQFRGVKTNFHHFWPPLENILGISPSAPPLEKILPTPMVVML